MSNYIVILIFLFIGVYICFHIWRIFFPKQTFFEKKLNHWAKLSPIAVKSIFYRNHRIHPWKKLAASTHLQFVLKANGDQDLASIKGKYGDYSLALKTIQNSIGVKSTILSLNKDTKSTSNYEKVVSQQTLSRFISLIQERNQIRGEIEVKNFGSTISYTQLGLENENEYLKYLFDFLCSLADLYDEVVILGGVAVDTLFEATESEDEFVKKITTNLIQDISQKTSNMPGSMVSELVCARCLTYCTAYLVQLSWTEKVEYYGCRICKQSQKFVDAPHRMVVVLDRTMIEKSDYNQNRVVLHK